MGPLHYKSELEEYETIIRAAYLYKHGMSMTMNGKERHEYRRMLTQMVRNGGLTRREMTAKLRCLFSSEHAMGSPSWVTDVRNFVADRASSLCNLVPPQPHLALQATRAKFVVYKYWMRSEALELKPSDVGGCLSSQGYSRTGDVLIENEEDIKRLKQNMKDVLASFSCKGNCSTKRCYCLRREQRCVGCICLEETCNNRMHSPTSADHTPHVNFALVDAGKTVEQAGDGGTMGLNTQTTENNDASSSESGESLAEVGSLEGLSTDSVMNVEDLETEVDELIESLE